MSYLDNFYYRLTGSKGSPRLVFLHGLMGFSANWQSIARAFETDFEILVYDQRGHGRSFQPESGYAPKDFATDLLKILDELEWEKVHLVGHSMGGRAALSFGHSHPERIEKLVIEDIGAEPSWESMSATRRMILSVPVPLPSRDAARQFFKGKFRETVEDVARAEALAAYLMANLQTLEDGSMDWRFSLKGVLESLEQGRTQTMWTEWEGLKVPTLLMRGTNSTLLLKETYTEMLRRQTIASGVEINSGHWIHSENPKDFIGELRKFLDN